MQYLPAATIVVREENCLITWLRSIVDTILGRVPGKPHVDTATRIWLGADFSEPETYVRTTREPGPQR
jgi:hypothetical protein